MLWVLTYGAKGGYPAAIASRPMFQRPAGVGLPPAGWVAMTQQQFDAEVASTNAAWRTYSAGLKDAPSGEKAFRMRSPDGSVFEITIDDDGALQRRKVNP